MLVPCILRPVPEPNPFCRHLMSQNFHAPAGPTNETSNPHRDEHICKAALNNANAMRMYGKLEAEFHRSETLFNGLKTLRVDQTDVFIATYQKSGTTMMQQLLYQLLAATGRVPTDAAGEAFSDISEVVPFIDAAPQTGIYESVNELSPRVWKTHSPPSAIPEEGIEKCRFVICFRDGLVVVASFMDFLFDWLVPEAKEASEDDRRDTYVLFIAKYFLRLSEDNTHPSGLNVDDILRYDKDENIPREKLGIWVSFLKNWVDLRHKNPNVLYILYDDMAADLRQTIRDVAAFVDIPVSPAVVDKVAAKCDRERMAADVRFHDMHIGRVMGWKGDGGWRARPAGVRGFKDVAIPRILLDVYWKMFRAAFGVDSFEELSQQIANFDHSAQKGSCSQ